MTKIKLNYVQLLFLITALLTVQWASTHVHFSEDHNHDENIHQHQLKTHTHQYISNNDLSTVTLSHSNIIELDSKDYTQNTKTEKPEFLDIAIQTFNVQVVTTLVTIEVPSFIHKRQGYSLYSSSNPRAPPLNS